MPHYDQGKVTICRENNCIYEIEQSYITHYDLAKMFCQVQARYVNTPERDEAQIELWIKKATEKRTQQLSFSLTLTKEQAEKLALQIAPWLNKGITTHD